MLLDRAPMPTTRTHPGTGLLGALLLVPAALWLSAEPLGDRFAGSYVTLTSLAVLLASVGITAFALNLVLGARLRAVARLFGGLDRMYVVHRRTGEVAFALLAGHVVLVLSGRATISSDSALALLGPGAGWTVFSGLLAFAAMTTAILLTLFGRLGHEVFVYVQRSFGIVFLVGAYHAFTTDSAFGSEASTAFLATVSTVGVGAYGYRSLFGRTLVRRRRYSVVAVNRLDELVTEIVMRPLGRPLEHAPGQFVFVGFRSLELAERLQPFQLSVERQVLSIRPGEIREQFHPFSITSAAGADELRITVKALGDYTSALRRLEPGAEALVEGPFGSFSYESLGTDRQIWLAGGIGVTPFLSMARSLGQGDGPAVAFYYCVESEDEAHFLSELRQIERSRDGFVVTVVARDRDGFVTGARIAREHPDLASSDVLVCGPPAMIDSLREQLLVEGLPTSRFHAEEFSFAKLGSDAAPVGEPGGRDEPRRRRRGGDGRLIAVLGAIVATALAFALGVAVGGSIVGDDEAGPAPPASSVPAEVER